jgi:ATP-dependent DNA helicase RecQ
MFDGTTAVRMALSAALRTEEWFGAGHLIDILLGAATDKVRERGHDRLPTYGVGGDYTKPQWQAIFRQMMGHDLMRPDPDRHGALRMTEKARPILRGEAQISLRRDVIRAARTGPKVRQMVAEADAPLLSALKARRRALAEAANVPAYVVFTDKTLIEMAETRPQTLDQMAGISGVGAKKLESYGRTFLELIAGAQPDLHPQRRKLAGRDAGGAYDRLVAVQTDLARGPDGTGKPMSCTAAQLARLAKLRDPDLAAIGGVIGERLADRFGAAFLAALHDTEDQLAG